MTEDKLDAIGWGIFFIWVGVCIYAGLGFAVGLLVTGIIVLGMQFIAKLSGYSFEGFWVVCGALFIIGGLWGVFKIEFELIPILLIAAGVLLIISVFSGKKSEQASTQ